MKIGDTVVMEFHMGGCVSEEEYEIVELEGDILTMDTDEEPDKCHKFNIKSGKCLTDSGIFGAKRTLKLD